MQKYSHLVFKYKYKINTPAGVKKYLSKVQVLSSVYLKVLKVQVHMYLASCLVYGV